MRIQNKQTKKDLARFAFYFFTGIFKVIPYWLLNFISDGLVTVAFWILKRMRKNAMDTLTIALGHEKSPEELKKICKECFYTLGKGFVELAYFVFHPKMITQKMTFRGDSKANLDAALKEGKGALAVTAHFGNFSLMFAFLAQMGYPTNAIMRPSRDEKLEQPLEDLRTQVGLKTIYSSPKLACVSQTIRALRNNEIVLVPMDQNHGSKSSVFVKFFDRPAGTASGPAIFALRTGAAIVPIFTVRTGKDTHEVIVEPHFFLEPKESDDETIQFNIQKITTIIERYVRKYPSEWGWMHRRWKSQPKEEQSGANQATTGDIL